MRGAGEDSAARTEADGWRILKDCPCGVQTRWKRRDILGGNVPCDRTMDVFYGSHCVAITAQQFCSISHGENLMRRDGISKTTVWKKCAFPWELRTCGNVPHFGMAVPSAKRGRSGGLLFIHDDRRRIDAHRAGCTADGSCSAAALWRHRTGGTLADRRTGGAGKRRDPVRQWGFPDLREA